MDWADEKARGIQQSLCRQSVSLVSSRAVDAIAAALREAEKRGAEAMQERIAQWHDEVRRILITNPEAYDERGANSHKISATTIRAMPTALPTEGATK